MSSGVCDAGEGGLHASGAVHHGRRCPGPVGSVSRGSRGGCPVLCDVAGVSGPLVGRAGSGDASGAPGLVEPSSHRVVGPVLHADSDAGVGERGSGSLAGWRQRTSVVPPAVERWAARGGLAEGAGSRERSVLGWGGLSLACARSAGEG